MNFTFFSSFSFSFVLLWCFFFFKSWMKIYCFVFLFVKIWTLQKIIIMFNLNNGTFCSFHKQKQRENVNRVIYKRKLFTWKFTKKQRKQPFESPELYFSTFAAQNSNDVRPFIDSIAWIERHAQAGEQFFFLLVYNRISDESFSKIFRYQSNREEVQRFYYQLIVWYGSIISFYFFPQFSRKWVFLHSTSTRNVMSDSQTICSQRKYNLRLKSDLWAVERGRKKNNSVESETNGRNGWKWLFRIYCQISRNIMLFFFFSFSFAPYKLNMTMNYAFIKFIKWK